MKIEGPSRASVATPTKKKDKVSGTDGSFSDMLTRETDDSQQAATTRSIAAIDSLLTAQAAEDPAQRAARQRMKARADKILKELDGLRIGLLTGTLTVGHVVDIADVVASHRERILDPRLSAVLDEIDLRAQIEIAKLCRAMDEK